PEVDVPAAHAAANIGGQACPIARNVHEGSRGYVCGVGGTDALFELCPGRRVPVPRVVRGFATVRGVVPGCEGRNLLRVRTAEPRVRRRTGGRWRSRLRRRRAARAGGAGDMPG